MLKFVKILKRRLVRLIDPDLHYSQPSFAQDGEDAILATFLQVFPAVAKFYVDVGAHHPKRYSNTYGLYLNGWRGINIDAMPGSMAAFERCRPDDINVEAAISATPQTLPFHIFNDPALNTFDAEMAKSRDGFAHFRITEKKAIRTQTLTEVLQARLPQGQKIGLLSIDVESFELEVLRSLDFSLFSPQYMLIEDKSIVSLLDVGASDVIKFLRNLGYEPVAKCYRTVLLVNGLKW